MMEVLDAMFTVLKKPYSMKRAMNRARLSVNRERPKQA